MLRSPLLSAFVSVLMLWFLALFDHSQAADIDINITETITVSESVDTLPSEIINVSELINVNDAVNVDIFPVVQINVSESVGVSDSVGTQSSAWIETSEPVTVSDTVTVDIYPVVQINISEIIAVSDSVESLPSIMISVTESVGVSDSVGTEPSAWMEVTENLTVSDTVTVDVFPVVDISISETVLVTDSITIRPSVMISVSELVNVSDSVAADAFFIPVADAGGPYTGVEGTPMTLDGAGSTDGGGNIVLYEWDIDGDGVFEYSSSSATQDHTYAYESIYTIILRVTNDSGVIDESISYADVLDAFPTADFTGYPTAGTPPLTVYFYNYSDGYDQPLTYEWDFENDGIIDSTLAEPWHEYPLGIYSVKLTVTDSDGSTSTLLRTNYVSSCLSPVRINVEPPWYYTTIQSAYDEAYNSEVIQSRDRTFSENLFIDRNLSIYFEAGYNCDYSVDVGVTKISGNIIISDGILILQSGTLNIK